MTAKSDFTDEEWSLVSEGPVTAGMIVLTAQRGGSFRETYAMAKAYTEARSQHGESELLDELVASKPDFDRHRYSTPESLREDGTARIGEAVKLLREQATPPEVESYSAFVIALAERVAGAHREDGVEVSPAEQQALDAIRTALA